MCDLPAEFDTFLVYNQEDVPEGGRKFTLIFTYHVEVGGFKKLLPWRGPAWHVPRSEERMIGDTGFAKKRTRWTDRFKEHIRQELRKTGKRLVVRDGTLWLVDQVEGDK